ncbi:MAG: FAD-dependent oxidoreductase [Alphaproteobacteria bacterium]|nr:MAG: FAD-dependent oxidoreductase [Alphaproteobacteria bacterium]
MSDTLPSQAEIVIIGGGAIGCSIAYHLTKLGHKDVVLLERGTLTCGTSWHAAGLVMQLRATHTMTELCRYSADLYEKLEAETGQATGFRRSGSLPVARTSARMTELKRLASLGRYFDVPVDILSPAEVAERYPLIDIKQVVGGLFIPGDGQTNPIDTTMALAKGARMRGARIFERARVTGLEAAGGAVKTVRTERGDIACDKIMLCGGLWSRDLAAMIGVNVPLFASEHMYVTTAPMEGVRPNLPVIRDTDGYVYIKEDAGKLLVGAFEPACKPLPVENLPAQFEFGELPEDWDHFALPMSKAIELVPALETAQIRHFLNGPESFTPDNKFILGEAPEVRNFFVAAGFNSQGILSAAGVGRAMADWISSGEPQMDLSEVDIARFARFQVNRRYLRERTTESLGLLYAMHWPFRQVESARPVRQGALHERLKARNACFGETAGWERANWYAPAGVTPAYEYAYGRQNWFPYVGEEHKAVRERVGMFDLSSFAKFQIEGPDAERELQRLCGNNVAVPVGRIVYTQMLNSRGGIQADVTVSRLGEDRFWVVTAAANQVRDLTWIRRNIDGAARVIIVDITSAYSVLPVMGPNARELLARVSPADFGNAAFPFGTLQQIEIGYGMAHALRVTYVGELGWELYIPTEFVGPIFDLLEAEGRDLGLRLAGYHALDSLRSEKGYRHWGHDISPADTPFEAGLGFAVDLKGKGDFIGRAALEARKSQPMTRRLVHFRMQEPEPVLFHDEPIYRDGRIVGRLTSGSYGYSIGAAVGMGYVECADGVTADFVEQGSYEIEIAAERFPAIASLRPFYDPASTRVRL